MADGPTTPILDDFNRANENPLSGGGNWSQATSAASVTLASNATAATGANVAAAWVRGGIISDFEVYATLVSGVINTQGVLGRMKDLGGVNTYDGYYGNIYALGPSLLAIVRYVDRVASTIATTTLSSTPIIGDKIMLRGIGPVLQLWWFSSALSQWMPPLVTTDTTFISGYIGIGYGAGAGAGMDDFGGGVPIDSLGSGSAHLIGRGAGRWG